MDRDARLGRKSFTDAPRNRDVDQQNRFLVSHHDMK